MRLIGQIHIVLLVFILFSCTQDNKQNKLNNSKDSSNGMQNNGAIADIELLDRSKWKDIKSQYQGKIIFVNVWATWCLPCKEEFPDIVKLSADYSNSEVIFIGISVDYPDEIENKVKPFLQSQDVPFQNYVQNFKKQEDFINLFNENWRGAVPATFIYDKRGIQKSFLLGKQSFTTFKQTVDQIIDAG